MESPEDAIVVVRNVIEDLEDSIVPVLNLIDPQQVAIFPSSKAARQMYNHDQVWRKVHKPHQSLGFCTGSSSDGRGHTVFAAWIDTFVLETRTVQILACLDAYGGPVAERTSRQHQLVLGGRGPIVIIVVESITSKWSRLSLAQTSTTRYCQADVREGKLTV